MASVLRLGLHHRRDGAQVKRGPRRRQPAPWEPTYSGMNPAGLVQLRELIELLALLLECSAAAGVGTSATMERAFEHSANAIGQLRERVYALARLNDVKPRLVKPS